eukprot:Nitzschia sp. Nitz4//scaffold131_size63436//34189//35346//NITZ4_006275-RA/size63436-processed-gene-0.117-mRNA-1//-1//CDS//3329535268//6856//frame0
MSNNPRDATFLYEIIKAGNFEEIRKVIELDVTQDLLHQLWDIKEDGLRYQGNILHFLLEHERVPIDLISEIIELTTPSMDGNEKPPSSPLLSHVTDFGSTPLLVATTNIAQRPDIIELLVRAYPPAVTISDFSSLGPIDSISNRIVMAEESRKYVGGLHQYEDNTYEQAQDINVDQLQLEDQWYGPLKPRCLWKTLHILVLAEITSGNLPPVEAWPPLVHCCLRRRSSVPYAVLERTLKTCDLAIPDTMGNRPLHIVADSLPTDDDDDDDDDESVDSFADQEEDRLLQFVVQQLPVAASQRNKAGLLPFLVAWNSGRRWGPGMTDLCEAFPAAMFDLPESFASVVLAAVSHRPIVLFSLLHVLLESHIVSMDKSMSNTGSGGDKL